MGYSVDGMWGCGERPLKGDLVRCVATCYSNIKRDDIRTVASVRDGNVEIVYIGRRYPPGSSNFYKASSFELMERRTPPYLQPQEKKSVLHIAVFIQEGDDLNDIASRIERNLAGDTRVMADTSAQNLKNRVAAKLEDRGNASGFWLILSGNTVGERVPSHRFRSL